MADHYQIGGKVDLSPGCLLIAHPTGILSGLFSRSIVLITERFKGSTNGLILNKPLQGATERDIMSEHGWKNGNPKKTLHLGGPVNSNSLALLHNDNWHSRNTLSVCDGIGLSSDPEMIESIARGYAPENYSWVAGVSGWRVGQLENEIEGKGSWSKPQWLAVERCAWDPQEFLWKNHDGIASWRRAIELYSSVQTREWL